MNVPMRPTQMILCVLTGILATFLIFVPSIIARGDDFYPAFPLNTALNTDGIKNSVPQKRNVSGQPEQIQTETKTPKKRLSDDFQLRGQSGSLPPLRLESEMHCDPSFYEQSIAACPSQSWSGQAWTWQFLPDGFIYDSYLAGMNESRLGAVFNYDEDVHWIWDITLGGKLPFLRFGNKSGTSPEGFQIDIEGSSHLRLDFENEMDMDAADFRAGMPFTYGNQVWQVKTGYYHVSSHLGDERILRLQQEGVPHNRINYVREAWILGFSYRLRPSLRAYIEADYAFSRGECTRPWHFQFGLEYASRYPTNGFWGKPFAAVNVLLLQEHNYDGNINVQAGWQWRGKRNQVFRVGLQYFGGVSEQYEHISKREHKVGFGLWYDF